MLQPAQTKLASRQYCRKRQVSECRRGAGKGCVHGDDQTSQGAVRTTVGRQGQRYVMRREQDPRPTLLRAGPAHYARVARTRGGGCFVPGNPSSSGWLRRGTHQLGCAWWRHHVTSLPLPLPSPLGLSREDRHPHHPAAPAFPLRLLTRRSRAGKCSASGRDFAAVRRSAARREDKRVAAAAPAVFCVKVKHNHSPARLPPNPSLAVLPSIPTAAAMRPASASPALLDHCPSLSLGFLPGQPRMRRSIPREKIPSSFSHVYISCRVALL